MGLLACFQGCHCDLRSAKRLGFCILIGVTNLQKLFYQACQGQILRVGRKGYVANLAEDLTKRCVVCQAPAKRRPLRLHFDLIVKCYP